MTLYETMSIGDLIEALSQHKDGLPVYFDWCSLRPTKPASYRGDYSHLAIGFDFEAPTTVGQLRGWLHDAIGNRFHGYKGGSFEMLRTTPVFCARWGETGRRIVSVSASGSDEPWCVILHTEPDN